MTTQNSKKVTMNNDQGWRIAFAAILNTAHKAFEVDGSRLQSNLQREQSSGSKSISQFIEYLKKELGLSIWNVDYDTYDHDSQRIVSFHTYYDFEEHDLYVYDMKCTLHDGYWNCEFIEVEYAVKPKSKFLGGLYPVDSPLSKQLGEII